MRMPEAKALCVFVARLRVLNAPANPGHKFGFLALSPAVALPSIGPSGLARVAHRADLGSRGDLDALGHT